MDGGAILTAICRLGESAVAGILVTGAFVSIAEAQLRTEDAAETRALAVQGEFTVGVYRTPPIPELAVIGIDPAQPDAPILTLSADATGRLLALGGAEERLYLEVDADVRVGWLDLDTRVDGGSDAWLGNAWVAVAIAHREPGWTLRGGVGVGLPLATVTGEIRFDGVDGSWGRWNAWSLRERMVPVGAHGLYEARFAGIDVGADAVVIAGPRFGLGGYPLEYDRAFWLYSGLGGWLTGHLGPWVDLGMRLQGVFTFRQWTNPGLSGEIEHTRTDFQASLVPFVRANFAPGHLELRFQLNLDEPYGPPFSGSGTVWALALQGGAAWDP